MEQIYYIIKDSPTLYNTFETAYKVLENEVQREIRDDFYNTFQLQDRTNQDFLGTELLIYGKH
jgi:hypothetical protein